MCRDFRKMLDTNYLRAWDLQGDTTVTITRIEPEKVGWGKKARTMPVFYFQELNKGLACNATNGATIGQVHGAYDPDVLLGKQITLYPTTTEMQGSLAECIRVRPKGFVPRGTPARIAQQVHQNNQRREQQQPQQTNGKPVNGKPVVTQADQLLADQALKNWTRR